MARLRPLISASLLRSRDLQRFPPAQVTASDVTWRYAMPKAVTYASFFAPHRKVDSLTARGHFALGARSLRFKSRLNAQVGSSQLRDVARSVRFRGLWLLADAFIQRRVTSNMK